MSDPKLFHSVDYRGATVEDLDIRPAISINPSTPLDRAFEVSFENEFTYLPVIHETNKRLLGVLNVGSLNARNTSMKPVTKNFMLWFNQNAQEKYKQELAEKDVNAKNKTPINSKILKPRATRGKRYEVLTPLSPLEQLAAFFNSGNYFAIITNGDGNLVYGVVTPEDLTKYERARPRL